MSTRGTSRRNQSLQQVTTSRVTHSSSRSVRRNSLGRSFGRRRVSRSRGNGRGQTNSRNLDNINIKDTRVDQIINFNEETCRIGLEYEVKKIIQNREISIRATVLSASVIKIPISTSQLANRNVFRHKYISQNTNFSSNLQENILENTQSISLVPQSSVSLNNSQTQFVNIQQSDLAINQQTPKSLNIPGCEGQQTASSNHVSIDLMQHESNNNLNHDMQNESLDIHVFQEDRRKFTQNIESSNDFPERSTQNNQVERMTQSNENDNSNHANFSTSETTLLRISNNTENMMRNFDSQTVVQRKVLEQLESLNKNMHVVNEVERKEKNTVPDMRSFNRILSQKIQNDEFLNEFWCQTKKSTTIPISQIEEQKPLEIIRIKNEMAKFVPIGKSFKEAWSLAMKANNTYRYSKKNL